MKPVEFCGDSIQRLSAFPELARREAGFQLARVQAGFEPTDWKPLPSVGQGVREIRVRERSGAFRVMYVASFGNTVYVLHCFQKKTQKTSRADIDTAVWRFKELSREARG